MSVLLGCGRPGGGWHLCHHENEDGDWEGWGSKNLGELAVTWNHASQGGDDEMTS